MMRVVGESPVQSSFGGAFALNSPRLSAPPGSDTNREQCSKGERDQCKAFSGFRSDPCLVASDMFDLAGFLAAGSESEVLGHKFPGWHL